MVESDQVLSYSAPLGLIRLQDRPLGNAIDNKTNLPAKIVAVLHGNVHALPRFGRVRVYSIPREKDAVVCAEAIANPLADLHRTCQRDKLINFPRSQSYLISRPPIAVIVCQLIRAQCLLGAL